MMMRRVALAVLLIGFAISSPAAERDPSRGGDVSPVVVRGTVEHVIHGFAIVLVDGTEIEFTPATEWMGTVDSADLHPGDSIVVAGREETGASVRTIVAGGIRVVTGRGRVAPLTAPVCLEPVPGKGRVITKRVVKTGADTAGTLESETRTELGYGYDDGGSRIDTDGEGVAFESLGLVLQLQPPNRFVLDDQRSYVVDGLTVFDNPIVSYAGLMVGQYLYVKAKYQGGGVYRALEVEYQGERSGGQGYVRLEGTVDTISASSITLIDNTVVRLASTTDFNGDADSAQEAAPGWRVEIYALHNLVGDLVATSVRFESPERATTLGHEFVPHDAVLVISDEALAEEVASRHDAIVSGQVSSTSVLLTFEQEIDDELLSELEADPEIEAVEPNFLFRDPESVRRRFVIVDRSPSIREYKGQAAALKHGVAEAVAMADGSGAVVAIMDTGVDRCHPLLGGHLAAGGLDLVDGDMSPWETNNGIDDDEDGEVDEAVGHGTFVASLVALAAPGAKILPYRVLDDDGSGTAFNLAIAVADAIERGVDVINLSLAYRRRSKVVDLLLEQAEERGIVVVAAAGNDGDTALPFPAIDGHVLAVTALRPDGEGLAEFANRGEKAVVAAIGEEVYGGLQGGQFGTSSGTSLAAPFATAGAAIAKSLDPGVSAEIVRQLLIQTGTPVSDASWAGRSLDLGRAVDAVSP